MPVERRERSEPLAPGPRPPAPGPRSIVVEASAGTGKTTALMPCAPLSVETEIPTTLPKASSSGPPELPG